MMGMISFFVGCGLAVGVVILVVVSLRDRPAAKEKLAGSTTRIEFPVKAELKELETKVHRQVREIQEIAEATVPMACPAPPPLVPSPKTARPSEHDTRMIRMVTEKAEEIQRLAEESTKESA